MSEENINDKYNKPLVWCNISLKLKNQNIRMQNC